MLLDTNVVSAYLKPDAPTKYPRLDSFVRALPLTEGIAISFVTQFELRRGLEELRLRRQGTKQYVTLLKFLSQCDVLGLDGGGGGEGWNLAAELWAKGRAHKPSIVFKDADLLIAATAVFHGRTLATSEKKLVENLVAIGVESVVQVPLE